MALSEHDKQLLERCLEHQPRSWQDFVDRFMGLVMHVINHSTQSRNMKLNHADIEDLVSEVFLNIVRKRLSTAARVPWRKFIGHLSDRRDTPHRSVATVKDQADCSIERATHQRCRHERSSSRAGLPTNRDQVEKLLDQTTAPRPNSSNSIISMARATTKSVNKLASRLTQSARH